MDRYLRETPMLDYGSASIQALIHKHGWNELPETERVRAIYNYVRDEVLFGYNIDDSIPASRVLADGFGQCNTKGALFMALLRPCGIPCRVHGFMIDKKLQKGAMTGIVYRNAPQEILHSWVEVLLDGHWHELEGFILDKGYLGSLQAAHPECSGAFCGYGVAVKEGDESPYRNGCIPAGAASAAVVEAAEQAALAFEQAMYKFETHRALAVCDDYLRAANKRWSDASKAANKLEGEPANAAMTQALVDAFTELRVATVLMHGIVPAGCELICEYFDVDPVVFFSWDNIFASTDEFVESLGEKPGEHRVKPLPPRFDFFSKHESQY